MTAIALDETIDTLQPTNAATPNTSAQNSMPIGRAENQHPHRHRNRTTARPETCLKRPYPSDSKRRYANAHHKQKYDVQREVVAEILRRT